MEGRKRPKLVSRRPPRRRTIGLREAMIWLREAMIWLREAMIWLREAMIWLREAMICLHEAMICLREAMICLREAMICLHEAMICLREATIGLQGVRRICQNWWLSNENPLRSRSRSTSFISASHRAAKRRAHAPAPGRSHRWAPHPLPRRARSLPAAYRTRHTIPRSRLSSMRRASLSSPSSPIPVSRMPAASGPTVCGHGAKQHVDAWAMALHERTADDIDKQSRGVLIEGQSSSPLPARRGHQLCEPHSLCGRKSFT
jgi:hypothetical protein